MFMYIDFTPCGNLWMEILNRPIILHIIMKNLIVLTFGIALSSCSYSNNDFCECDYFKRDDDVEIFYDQKFIETATFKGKPLTGTVCDMVGRYGQLVEEATTFEDGIETLNREYHIDGKTVIKETFMEEGNNVEIEYYLNGEIHSKTISNTEGRISTEDYWYNGNLRKTYNYLDKSKSEYNSLGELIVE